MFPSPAERAALLVCLVPFQLYPWKCDSRLESSCHCIVLTGCASSEHLPVLESNRFLNSPVADTALPGSRTDPQHPWRYPPIALFPVFGFLALSFGVILSVMPQDEF